jgi:hypothetical protein
MKKQLIQMNFTGMTEKQYDQVWDELRKAGQSNPHGLIHHVAAFQGKNFLVNDVWESTDAFERFGKVLNPIMKKLGIHETKPIITPVHYEYSGVEASVTH